MRDVLVQYRQSTKGITYNLSRKQYIYSRLARKFYKERIVNGHDSYGSIDFDSDAIAFLHTSDDQINRQAKRNQVIFALGIGDNIVARQLLRSYIKGPGAKANLDRKLLVLFAYCPWCYRLYRWARYGLGPTF